MANDDEGTPCSGALGGGSPRVRQITQQRVERCGRAGQYGQAFFDKIWFHGRSVLLPNTQISVTDQGFHLIPHRFEFRRIESDLQPPLLRGFVRNSKRSEEHTSELQSRQYLVCRLLLEKKKKNT